MTPDEIRVAIRLLNQTVVYESRYPVVHTHEGYVIRWGLDRPLFGKDGEFRKNWLGQPLYSAHLFKVVDELPFNVRVANNTGPK
jgi:hypothetical protein